MVGARLGRIGMTMISLRPTALALVLALSACVQPGYQGSPYSSGGYPAGSWGQPAGAGYGYGHGGNIPGWIFLCPARKASRRRAEPLGGKSGA